MLLSARNLLLALSMVVTAVGVAMLVGTPTGWLVWTIIGCGAASIIALLAWPSLLSAGAGASHRGPAEPEDIACIAPERWRELVRGTSKYLRELRYRYSIRFDSSESRERRPFSAEVNSIRLGFLPVIIIDNANDRQGFGYAAFVHDGRRWRGPGLPCPAGQTDAVKHAARCVSPLAKDEETKF